MCKCTNNYIRTNYQFAKANFEFVYTNIGCFVNSKYSFVNRKKINSLSALVLQQIQI